MRFTVSSLLLFGLLSPSRAVTVNHDLREEAAARDCCQTLQRQLGPTAVLFPGSSGFQQLVNSYYSRQESEIVSQCRVSARSAKDVSDAIKVITNTGCKFAVRSVGHMPWAGAANIAAPGVTIDLKLMNSVDVSADRKTVSLGPGGSWGPVYDTLDHFNLTAVGGRSNTVGVGGFTLGGGFSNLSPSHGFASDNVINYQVVLADGRIVNANKNSNSDLYRGLKAGSTNLGIITRYDVNAFPLTQKWGGSRGYNVSQGPAIFDAMAKFTRKLPKEPLGGGSVVWGYNEQMKNDTIFATFAYLGADGTQSKAELFSEMLDVPFNSDTIRTNTNQQALSDEVDVAFPPGLRRIFATLTFKVDTQIAVGVYEKSHEAFAGLVGKEGISWSASFQPISVTHLQATQRAGGTLQGLSPKDGDLILLNLNSVWVNESDDAAMQAAVRKVINWATQEAKKRNVLHPWLYINYALPDQDVYSSYGRDNIKVLKQIQAKYDNKNLLAKLWKGGFKL
ncbi:hypothetical protein CCMSSC00406_0007113 [Pleurotus cornucopiae]|uniref:Uncharacterized protein n=1 Tax=Pleurotus cornucopiae TaxID=5321 RepID=A0ACB7IPM6_PLECO|nr:hypothetical protein CCMSSC00406_0007113 [Pleurotus cornucopiae]